MPATRVAWTASKNAMLINTMLSVQGHGWRAARTSGLQPDFTLFPLENDIKRVFFATVVLLMS
jgi:hypothetical protein